MLNAEGRKAKTEEDAKNFIHKFLLETLFNATEHSFSKAHDFDLYLPMMMDWVLNLPADKNDVFTPTDELEALYMETAWSMVQQGLIRPGPKTTNGESGGDAYGKGYSLTSKGKAWLNEGRNGTHPEPVQGEPSNAGPG